MSKLRGRRPSPAIVIAILALVAAVAGSAVADPVANTAVSKKKTKKIAKKEAKKFFNANIGDASVANAENLGGDPAGDYEKKADTLFATVAPGNDVVAIVRGRGADSVTKQSTGTFRVTFNRDVADCTWLATYGQPGNAAADRRFATVQGTPNANQVDVVLWSPAAQTPTDGQGFHVEVRCP